MMSSQYCYCMYCQTQLNCEDDCDEEAWSDVEWDAVDALLLLKDLNNAINETEEIACD